MDRHSARLGIRIRAGTPRGAGLLVLALLATACASTRMDLDYDPAPAELILKGTGGESDPVARVLISLVEARRAGPERTGDWELVAHLRVENDRADSVIVRAGEMLLVDGELREFGAAILAELPSPVERGAARQFTAVFPFPEGREPSQIDLDGLNLRCPLDVDGRRIVLAATFQRVRPYIPPSPRVRVGLGYHYGYGYHHHHGAGWWW